MPETLRRFPRGTHLRHHGGSVWKVIRYAANDDYRIRCVVGTVREGFIGGEVEGRVTTVHHDYLHGDGWTLTSDTAACPDTLLTALQAVQNQAPALPKDKANPHFKSRYTSLDTIVETVGPLLHAHGLLWTTLPGGSHEQPTLSYRLAHVESGEVLEGTMPLLLDKHSAQALGSALTYARRYSLCAVLNLVADEDDDGTAASTGQQNTSRVGTGKGFASDAQQKLIKTLATQKGVGVKQLAVMLADLGADVEPTAGWTGRLSGGRDGAASALISWLKEEDRKIPSLDHPSDLAEPAAGEFEHPAADPSGTPLAENDVEPDDDERREPPMELVG